MAFGRLDIILGTDVRGLETALGTAETITNRIQKKFEETSQASVKMGNTISLVSGRIGTSMRLISQSINRIDVTRFTSEQNKMIAKTQETIEKLTNVSDIITTTSTVFNTFASVGSKAIATIAARVPALTAALNAMLGPWGLIATVAIAAATAIAFNWSRANSTIKESENVTRLLSESQKAAEKDIIPQISKVQQLTSVVKDSTVAYRDRVRALNELKGISPAFFSDLDIEKSKIEGLDVAVVKYRENLVKLAQVKRLNATLDEAIGKSLDIKNEIDTYGDDSLKGKAQKFLDNLTDFDAKGLNAKKTLLVAGARAFISSKKTIAKEAAQADKEIDAIIKSINEASKGIIDETVTPKAGKALKSIDPIKQAIENVKRELANTNFSVSSGFTTEIDGINNSINTLQRGLIRLSGLGVAPDNSAVLEFKKELTDLNNLLPKVSLNDVINKLNNELSSTQNNIELGITSDTDGIRSDIRDIQNAILKIAALKINTDDTDLIELRDDTLSGLQEKLKEVQDTAKDFKVNAIFDQSFEFGQTQFDQSDLGIITKLEAVRNLINNTKKSIAELAAQGIALDDSRIIALQDSLVGLNDNLQGLTITSKINEINAALQQQDVNLFAGIITDADNANNKIGIIKSGLIQLISEGIDPTDEAFQKLLGTLNQLSLKGSDSLAKIASTASEVASAASQAANVLASFNDNTLQERSQELEDYYNKEKALIDASYLPNVIKAKKIEQLEKKVSQEKRKIQRDEAVANKRKAIFDSIINTAVAITSALTRDPTGILAGIVGALGIAQTAAIAAAPIPQLAKGGIVYGNTLVNVGEYPGAKTNPEVIAPLDKLTDIIRVTIGDIAPGGSDPVILHSVIRGDDLHLLGQLQDYKSKRIR
jgi:hypothetical protein